MFLEETSYLTPEERHYLLEQARIVLNEMMLLNAHSFSTLSSLSHKHIGTFKLLGFIQLVAKAKELNKSYRYQFNIMSTFEEFRQHLIEAKESLDRYLLQY